MGVHGAQAAWPVCTEGKCWGLWCSEPAQAPDGHHLRTKLTVPTVARGQWSAVFEGEGQSVGVFWQGKEKVLEALIMHCWEKGFVQKDQPDK